MDDHQARINNLLDCLEEPERAELKLAIRKITSDSVSDSTVEDVPDTQV